MIWPISSQWRDSHCLNPLSALSSVMDFSLPDEKSNPQWEHSGVDWRKQIAELARRK